MAEEPEEQMEGVEEPEGDPVPPPSAKSRGGEEPSGKRRPGRPKGSRTRKPALVVGDLPGDPDLLPKPAASRRTSRDAKAGGEAAWGLVGTGFMLGGQAAQAPGLVAGGWVMQAQAREGGIWLAQRLMDTRYYPWLERLGKGGSGGAIVAAPILTALYVQLPPARPMIGAVLGGMIGKLEVEVPMQNPETGEQIIQKVNLWGQIQAETAQADYEAAQQAQARAATEAEPEFPPVYDEPEPGVTHVRSVYNEFTDVPHDIPPEI